MVQQTKGALQSTAVLGGALTTIASTIAILQQVTEAVAAVEPAILAVVTAVGGLLSIWGRIKATKKISSWF